jgi:O-antigen ligase
MPGSLPFVRPEWLVLLVGLMLLPISRRAVSHPVAKWTVFTLCAYLVSSMYGSFVLDLPMDIRDITEYMKPVLYFLLFLFTSCAKLSGQDFRMLLRVFIISLTTSSLVALIQYIEPDTIASLLLLYRPDLEGLENYREHRAWGTMTNPNIMGFISATSFGLCLFPLRYRLFPHAISFIFLAISFLAVFATGSRTGMVCLMVWIVAYFILELRKNYKSFMAGACVVAIIGWAFSEFLLDSDLAPATMRRIVSLGAINEDTGGWVLRIENAIALIDSIASSPIFGHGPSKAFFASLANIDNEYIQILYRFGLLGLIATVGFICALVFQRKRYLFTRPSLASLQVNIASISLPLLGVAALFAFTAGTYGTFQIMFLLIVLWNLPIYISTIDKVA